MTRGDSDIILLITCHLYLSCLICSSNLVKIMRNLYCLNNYFIQVLQCLINCVIVCYFLHYKNQLIFYIDVVTDYLTITNSAHYPLAFMSLFIMWTHDTLKAFKMIIQYINMLGQMINNFSMWIRNVVLKLSSLINTGVADINYHKYKVRTIVFN